MAKHIANSEAPTAPSQVFQTTKKCHRCSICQFTEAKDNGGRKEGEESAQPEIDTVGQSNNEPEACRRLEGEHSNHETRTSKINPIAFATQAGDTIHLQQAMKQQPDKMQFLKAMEEEVMTHGR